MTRLPPLPSVQRTHETKMAAHAVSIALDDLTEKLGTLNKLAQKQIHQVC